MVVKGRVRRIRARENRWTMSDVYSGCDLGSLSRPGVVSLQEKKVCTVHPLEEYFGVLLYACSRFSSAEGFYRRMERSDGAVQSHEV